MATKKTPKKESEEKDVKPQKAHTCAVCGGTGLADRDNLCATCNGTGTI